MTSTGSARTLKELVAQSFLRRMIKLEPRAAPRQLSHCLDARCRHGTENERHIVPVRRPGQYLRRPRSHQPLQSDGCDAERRVVVDSENLRAQIRA